MIFCFVLLCQNHTDNPAPKGFQTNNILNLFLSKQWIVPVSLCMGEGHFLWLKETNFTEENVFCFESLLISVLYPVADRQEATSGQKGGHNGSILTNGCNCAEWTCVWPDSGYFPLVPPHGGLRPH